MDRQLVKPRPQTIKLTRPFSVFPDRSLPDLYFHKGNCVIYQSSHKSCLRESRMLLIMLHHYIYFATQ